MTSTLVYGDEDSDIDVDDEEKDIEEGEDLIDANMADDYKSDDIQDVYASEELDDTTYDPITAKERRAAERLLAEQDRREGRNRRTFIPHALMDDDDKIPPEYLLQLHGRLAADEAALLADDAQPGEVNLEDYDGPLREFLKEDRVKREIKIHLKQFLTQYNIDNIAIYPKKIRDLCQENGCSLEVAYHHLSDFSSILAIWIMEQPQTIFDLFDEVVMEVAQISFSDYSSMVPHIHIRLSELPIDDQLRELRQIHLNGVILVNGVVTQRTAIFPQLLLVRFDCLKCGYVTAPIAQMSGNSNSLQRSNGGENRPISCPDCQSSGPFKMNEAETIYRNFQRIVLQEAPGSVDAGLIPRSCDVYLMDDLCDRVRPGEEIKVTGIYKNLFDTSLNAQQGFPVFSTIIEANHISKSEDFYSAFEMTDEDRLAIVNLAKNPNIEQMLINSIAPSIYGYDYIKRSIAYALFGGMEKTGDSKHRIRGDINILILGDPGCGKSQFLKYVQGIAFRCIYATGKGASAVGLTAYVSRDVMTGDWTLHGGALVMADRGICLIDEFDKMNDHDRTSIHEAMEQQSISISKAGIVATLHARCSVIAVANPIRGRYDGTLTFVQNVDLTDPLLSRFDVLAVVRDRVDPLQDEKLAGFVIDNHIISHPTNMANAEKRNAADSDIDMDINVDVERAINARKEVPGISQTLLRKYILYAKRNCNPKLDNIDQNKISEFYSDLRQKSMQGGGIPIAVRHVESLLRLSEARAKMHLREYVNDEDVNMAIRVLLESFIDTQKQSVQTTLSRHYRPYLTYKRDTNELLMYVLQQTVKEELRSRELRRPVGGADDEDSDANPDLDKKMDGDDSGVEIEIRYFEQRAVTEQMQITENDFRNFYKSQKFIKFGFQILDNRKIVKSFRIDYVDE